MPTVNPRVNVTLSVSLDMLVGQLARSQRVSKSQVLRELLEAAEPALQRAVSLMELAANASAEVRSGLAQHLSRDVENAHDAVAVLLSRVDRGLDLVGQAEAVRGKRPARQAAAPDEGSRLRGERTPRLPVETLPHARKNPPSSNRGVKSPRTPAKSRRRSGA